MKILTRYIIKELVSNFILSIFVLTSVFITIDFLGRIWEFMDKIPPSLMFEYFIAKTPWVIYNMIPISCLLATLLTFAELSKNNEVLAMYAGGVSLYRLTSIVFFIGIILTITSFLLNEFIVPPSIAKSDYIMEVNVKGRNYQAFKKSKIWYRGKNLIYNLQFFEPSERIIQGISIYFFNNDFKVTKEIYAEKAKWLENNWTLYEGTVVDFEASNYPKIREFSEEVVYLPEKPEDLTVIEKSTDTVSFRELKDYVLKSKRAGLKSRTYEVDMHSKVALPFACIIMMFLALPFAIKHNRAGGLAINIGYTFVFVLSYVFIQAISISYGHNGKLTPMFSAWLTNFVFAIFAIYMISKAKT